MVANIQVERLIQGIVTNLFFQMSKVKAQLGVSTWKIRKMVVVVVLSIELLVEQG